MKLTSLFLTGLFALLPATGVPRPAAAAPFDGRPKILLHLAGTTTRNQCASGQLSDCGSAVVAGDLAGASGPFYFAYVLAARGDMPDVAGIEFGIRYQDGCITGQQDGQGIDVFAWANCATLEFATTGTYAWPAPGGSNLITWNPGALCQTGETAVAGYFYVGCYGTADTLRIAPRPVSGLAKLAHCSSTERILAETDLGSVVFSPGGGASGCNPCNEPCQSPPTYLTCSAVSDINPPAPVVLTIVDMGATFVTLGWTATGDDGFSGGPAATYELRYSSTGAPTLVGEMPAPAAPGTFQSKTITGLGADEYLFELKVADDVPNWSRSYIRANLRWTNPDFTPPGAITDLATVSLGLYNVRLGWTCTGDDGLTGRATYYDLRRAAFPITAANFGNATPVDGLPAPLDPALHQEMDVVGLTAGTPYYFAIKASDEAGNVSPISNIASATTPTRTDFTPPAAITDLAPVSLGIHSVRLGWTCTGDDGLIGRATSHELRQATSPITAANFGSATLVAGLPAPLDPGLHQEVDVTGLTAGTPYYFAIKVRDDVPQESLISNIASATTLTQTDFAPPDAVTDLRAISAGPGSVRLGWTASGDDGTVGTATLYDIRYSGIPITAANFNSAAAATGEPVPQPAGSTQELNIAGLAAGALYYFAMRVMDDEDNISDISNFVMRRAADNSGAKLLLHTRALTVKNVCAAGQLADCGTASVNNAALYPILHFAYLLAGRFGEVGALQLGITYDLGAADGDANHRGIDIYGWTLCATSELPSTSPVAWPKPGSGNLITWNAASSCQSAGTAVAGYFYLGAYNSDRLQLTPRPSDGLARVFDCAGTPDTLPPEALGTAGYGRTGRNPCADDNPNVGVERTTWSRIKLLLPR